MKKIVALILFSPVIMNAQTFTDKIKRELKFDPDNERLLMDYGKALKALGRDREAMKAISRAKKLKQRLLDDAQDLEDGKAGR